MVGNFYSQNNDILILKIKAVPNSSKNEICGLYNDALKVKIKAPAVENKANEELVKFFAKMLKVPKTSVILKSGGTSKLKTLCIDGCTIENFTSVCDIIEINN